MQSIRSQTFPNGLVLLAESMPGVKSAAFTFLVPAGVIHEPANRGGIASMVAEWIMRGAGRRDSRELLIALDNLGVSHGESAQTVHVGLSGATLGRNLAPALEIYADVLRRPSLDEDEVEPIRSLCEQSLQSLEDDPGSKVMVELRKRHFPDPWGRSSLGDEAGLAAATANEMRSFFTSNFRANGAILAVAGAIDWPTLVSSVERLFGDWPAKQVAPSSPCPAGPRRAHIPKDTQQIQIALAYPTVTISHPDYYLARAAAAILGGYASARLFTEVREKRGLCYSVYAGYEGLKDCAAVVCYAGTSTERAQETLDVTLDELRRLARSGVTADELDMMRAGLKSSLIMQQESSMSRSGSLASDWYYLGRVRPLEEIAAALDALTPSAVSAFAARQALNDLTIVTLGSKPLELRV